MEETYQDSIKKKITDNVRNNVNSINNLLSSEPNESTILEKSTEIMELLKINTEDFIKNEPKSDYYNLDKIDKLASLIEIDQLNFEPRDFKRKQRIGSDKGSSSSLSNLTLFPSVEDVNYGSNDETIKEIQSSIDEIKENLEKTSNKKISIDKIAEIKSHESAKRRKFISFLAGLKRLEDELSEIAISDNLQKNSEKEFYIDDKVVDELKVLNKVMLSVVNNFL